jgi:leucyl aminopeptidase (aminopeptidase T)
MNSTRCFPVWNLYLFFRRKNRNYERIEIMEKPSEIILKKCAGLKEDENLLIITDPLRENIGQNIYDTACSLYNRDNINIIVAPNRKIDGEEPPENAAKEMLNADVIIMPTTCSLSHTKASANARVNGARIISMPGITEEIYKRAIDIDYNELLTITYEIAKHFKNCNTVKAVSSSGTDITFSLKGRFPQYLTGIAHKNGSFVNLPDGELAFAPVEDSGKGIIVVDGSLMPDQNTGFGTIGLLKSPVSIYVEDGKITAVEGGPQADIFRNAINAADSKGKTIAEFALGTNPKARLSGNILEDEKILGTMHFAFGSNVTLGGKNQSNIHLDGVVTNPKIYIDDQLLPLDDFVRIYRK